MAISNSRKRKKYTVIAGSHKIHLGDKTKIMGIVNLTPDSFSNDGLFQSGYTAEKAVSFAKKLIKQGADIIDLGGESTRPGSNRISEKEEIARIIPAIKLLAKDVSVPISVDSYKPRVVKMALDAGATIVNDIMGTNPDKSLLKMVKDCNAAIVLMHIKGIPENMQRNVSYSNLIENIYKILQKSIEKCFEIGIKSDRIIIDPGIGFGKTLENNLEIVNRLNAFRSLNKPLLIGTSRKSFIGKVLDKEVDDRLIGTVSTVCTSIIRGAHIVRVHNVAAIKDAVIMTDAIVNEKIIQPDKE
ncbi:MAG: dihydropteroate synthase [Omnitrophica WOR_2 bacterium RIFOXYB2_FULL_38_16]|nr:MAG: dihydropteroate synthase [Omnitrophica WOR_2 bacterium RIFOXYA2_FULL_38_17]OGX56870.1 MAG: dihydropteroate synthase [Omnitrophica WOR_2 bacterium RIFOXYB2_FULL_38_16]HBG60790.1 dihydropteroate synthase [Candidatus Omnitrophota bacterium]